MQITQDNIMEITLDPVQLGKPVIKFLRQMTKKILSLKSEAKGFQQPGSGLFLGCIILIREFRCCVSGLASFWSLPSLLRFAKVVLAGMSMYQK